MVFQAEAEIRWLDHCEALLPGRRRPLSLAQQPTSDPRSSRRPAMTVLELRAVHRVHGRATTVVHALRGVDLTVDAASWSR